MNSTTAITVLPLSERTAKIELEKASAQRNQRFYEFRNESNDLPVIRLSIDTPIYRVANYRTNILQLRWVKMKGLNANFFSAGQENESVQKVQHDFLWDLAQTEKESIKSIVETLQEEQQRDPLLITATGIVVNGNRRLAAMRELNFTHVDCMVLPTSANEDDLRDIEVRLQMTPETRLEYGWINECIAIKDLKDHGRSIETIGGLMRLDPPSKVKEKIQMLTEIDLYLRDWKNAETDYDQLSDAEEIISQVAKRINKKDGVSKEIARHIAWILLDQRGGEGRIYDLRETTGSLMDSVVEKLREVYSNEINIGSNVNEEGLEIDLQEDSDQGGTNDQQVVNFLNTFKGNDIKQQDIINVCRVVIEAKKNIDRGNAALKAVTDAHTKLIEVDLTNANSSTYPGVRKQLEMIEQRIAFLKSELIKYETKSKE